MNEFLNNLAAAFTPARRKIIYHVAFAATLILTMHGVITADDATEYLLAASYLLFGGVTQMAAANVTEKENENAR